jgi:hypothetical protein
MLLIRQSKSQVLGVMRLGGKGLARCMDITPYLNPVGRGVDRPRNAHKGRIGRAENWENVQYSHRFFFSLSYFYSLSLPTITGWGCC